MRIRPLGSQVVLESKPFVATAIGILLVEKYKPDEMEFRVLAVGPKVRDIAVGDWVLTVASPGRQFELKIKGVEYKVRLADAREVLMVLP
jgi:co-chaperonin GroES (HSP10)